MEIQLLLIIIFTVCITTCFIGMIMDKVELVYVPTSIIVVATIYVMVTL
jgi:hypothetical protein